VSVELAGVVVTKCNLVMQENGNRMEMYRPTSFLKTCFQQQRTEKQSLTRNM
jgi:hypothetical protein